MADNFHRRPFSQAASVAGSTPAKAATFDGRRRSLCSETPQTSRVARSPSAARRLTRRLTTAHGRATQLAWLRSAVPPPCPSPACRRGKRPPAACDASLSTPYAPAHINPAGRQVPVRRPPAPAPAPSVPGVLFHKLQPMLHFTRRAHLRPSEAQGPRPSSTAAAHASPSSTLARG